MHNSENDDLWREFLNSLQTDTLIQSNEQVPKNLIDNDDANEDPDFTLCVDNYDLDEPDYLDDWLQVPKKEAVALVKDAFEFCDGVSIVYEDQRNLKLKSKTRKNSNEQVTLGSNLDLTNTNETNIGNEEDKNKNSTEQFINQLESASSCLINSLINNPSNETNNQVANNLPCTSSTDLTSIISSSNKTNQLETSKNDSQTVQLVSSNSPNNQHVSKEFIPTFTDFQRKQLDEQLRNHVQLLTQSCLLGYFVTDLNYVHEETYTLLNVLSGLNNNHIDLNEIRKRGKETNLLNNDQSQSNETNNESQNRQILVSSEFEIINLKDSLELINNIKEKNENKNSYDLKQGIPEKFLEIILCSPVFYNTSLIPKCKYKFQSQFKKAQFSDTEKILLIMGYNKFRHLTKDECCRCIRDHLLPHRHCNDIRRHLLNISNSERRQESLKELLKNQQQINQASLMNFNFIKEIHYKSPYDQADSVQLSSIYTLLIERIKMSSILKESRKQTISVVSQPQPQSQTQSSLNITLPGEDTQLIEPLPIDSAIESSTPIQTPAKTSTHENSSVTKPASKKQKLQENEIEKSAQKNSNKIPIPRRESQQNNSNIRALNQTTNQEILKNFSQPMTIIPQNLNQQPSIIIPPNFAGTILFQPTIHIHTSSKNKHLLELSNYRKIVPKPDKK